MKKFVFGALLALVLCIGLLPAAAVPAYATTYDLWVGGVQVTDENASDLTAAINTAAGSNVASGSASYKNGTLVLNGFSYSGAGYCYNPNYFAAVYTAGTDINISVKGTNSIVLNKESNGTSE
jgi:hypothetical protein